jgi:hypothetical protein
MKVKEKLKAKDVAHCPICEANAVESCNQPKNNDCPREEE